jgi:hypothetical protein
MIEQLPFIELDEHRQLEILSSSMCGVSEFWFECILENIHSELEALGFSDPNVMFSGFHSQGDGASFTCGTVDLNLFIKNEMKNDFDFQFLDDDGSYENNIDPELKVLYDESVGILKVNDKFIERLIDERFIDGYISRYNTRYYHEHSVTFEYQIDDYYIANIHEGEGPDMDTYTFTLDQVKNLGEFERYFSQYIGDWIITKCKSIYGRLEKEWESYNTEELKRLKEENELYNII